MVQVANWRLENMRKLRKTESILFFVDSLFFFFNLQTCILNIFVEESISAHQALHRMENSNLFSPGWHKTFQVEHYH